MARTFHRGLSAAVALLLVAACTTELASAMIHKNHYVSEARADFLIESFGIRDGGFLGLTVTNFAVNSASSDDAGAGTAVDHNVGFYIHETNSESSEVVDMLGCPLTEEAERSLPPIYMEGPTLVWNTTARGDDVGFYNIKFANCISDSTVSFDLTLVAYNVDADGSRNYLSAGDSALPNLFLFFFFVFAACSAVWFWRLHTAKSGVVRIHYMMGVLLVLKTLTLFFESLKFHYMKLSGDTSSAWSTLYYIFAFMKGVMLFVVLLLVGMGFQFMKRFSSKDRRVFAGVMVLVILDNVALIVIDEMSPGSQAYDTWSGILKLGDLIACGFILFPIVWMIKHLRDASTKDGKANAVDRLKLFRQFYIITVVYIYFTRIVVLLVESMLPYTALWVAAGLNQVATLAYFIYTGYQFQPVEANPYFRVNASDEDGMDVDIDLDSVEVSVSGSV